MFLYLMAKLVLRYKENEPMIKTIAFAYYYYFTMTA